MEANTKKNYPRRILGLLICLFPFALLLASLGDGISNRTHPTFSGIYFVTAGLIIGAVNFYLSFIRPVYLNKLKKQQKIKNVSDIPLLGTLFLLISGVIGFGSVGTAIIGLIAAIIDTGGTLWFLICTWRDSFLWDRQVNSSNRSQ